MSTELLEALANSIQTDDERDGRIYGFLYGLVTDIGDPQGLGRVRARVGAMHQNESSNWLLPLWPGAIESAPRVGDSIVVAFIDGNPNKGMFAVHATSTMRNRPTEAMILGSTFLRLYNDLVAKFNNLKSKFNTHLHSGVTTGGGTSGTPTLTDTDNDAAAALAGDGSQPSSLESGTRVLSSEAKVR